MKILFIYPPFCTPTIMPYSISYLQGYFKQFYFVGCLDINAKFHSMRFSAYYKSIKNKSSIEYAELLALFEKESRKLYSENNKAVVAGKKPELFDEMLSLILNKKPDIVAFSLVYNSQCFYALALIQELKKYNITCIAGGPAVNEKICIVCNNFPALNKQPSEDTVPDFSDYDEADYLSREIVIPLKTSTTCYYQQCAFCTHYAKTAYAEYPMEVVQKAIQQTEARHFFLIDDMIRKERLLELAKMLKQLNVKWWCQLKPTQDLKGIFPELHASGLHAVSWGVESGNQRMLNLMNKGTAVSDVEEILQQSHDAGIKNNVFCMFGFPTETKEEFLDTCCFLKKNKGNIDLVSTSIFGLQRASPVYAQPSKYCIAEIQEEKRTVLGNKITYSVSRGMSKKQVESMRQRYAKTINSIDKMPRVINSFKEQILFY